MMSENPTVPKWFWGVAFVLLTWNLIGVSQYFQYMSVSPEQLELLSEADRDLYLSYPWYAHFAFILAVFGGTVGNGLLILRKKWAHPVLLVSLVGVVIQTIHSVFIAEGGESLESGISFLTLLIIIIAAFLVWFAKFGIRKGWLV